MLPPQEVKRIGVPAGLPIDLKQALALLLGLRPFGVLSRMASSSLAPVAPASQPLLELHIVRHGETTANRAGIIQGQSLDPAFKLTELGESQAHAAGESWRGQQWWRVVASDLPRARQTAEIILSHRESAPEPSLQLEPLLRECAVGARTGKRIGVKESAARQEILQQDPSAVIPPHETAEDMAARARVFLQNLTHEAVESRVVAARVLVVRYQTHPHTPD